LTFTRPPLAGSHCKGPTALRLEIQAGSHNSIRPSARGSLGKKDLKTNRAIPGKIHGMAETEGESCLRLPMSTKGVNLWNPQASPAMKPALGWRSPVRRPCLTPRRRFGGWRWPLLNSLPRLNLCGRAPPAAPARSMLAWWRERAREKARRSLPPGLNGKTRLSPTSWALMTWDGSSGGQSTTASAPALMTLGVDRKNRDGSFVDQRFASRDNQSY